MQVNEVIWLQCFWYTFTIVVVFVQLDVFSTDFTRSKIILVIYYVQTAKSTWWDGDLFIRKQHSIIISVCKQGTSNKVCCRCFDWIAVWRLSSFDMYFITFKQPPLCYSACTFYIIHVNEKKKLVEIYRRFQWVCFFGYVFNALWTGNYMVHVNIGWISRVKKRAYQT